MTQLENGIKHKKVLFLSVSQKKICCKQNRKIIEFNLNVLSFFDMIPFS